MENDKSIFKYIKMCEEIIDEYKFLNKSEDDVRILDSVVAMKLEEECSEVSRAKIFTKLLSEDPLHTETFVLIVIDDYTDPMTFKVVRDDGVA